MPVDMSGSRPSPDPVFILRGLSSPVTCLKFHDEDHLYSGGGDGVVRGWEMVHRRVSSTLPAHPRSTVLWVEFPTTGQMVTQGRDGATRVWAAADADWTQIDDFKSSSMGFCAGCLVQPGTLIAVPGDQHSQVDLIDLRSRSVAARLQPKTADKELGMCMSIKANSDTHLLIGYEDGSVALWDIFTNSMIERRKCHEEAVMCLGFSSVLQKGFSGSADCTLKSWTILNNKIDDIGSVDLTNPGLNDICVRSDSKIIVTAGWDSKIRVFGAKKLKPLAVLSYHTDSVHCSAFSDSHLLACGAKDQQISVWDIYR